MNYQGTIFNSLLMVTAIEHYPFIYIYYNLIVWLLPHILISTIVYREKFALYQLLMVKLPGKSFPRRLLRCCHQAVAQAEVHWTKVGEARAFEPL